MTRAFSMIYLADPLSSPFQPVITLPKASRTPRTNTVPKLLPANGMAWANSLRTSSGKL